MITIYGWSTSARAAAIVGGDLVVYREVMPSPAPSGWSPAGVKLWEAVRDGVPLDLTPDQAGQTDRPDSDIEIAADVLMRVMVQPPDVVSGGFRERELVDLLDAAHQHLRAPIVLVWDRLSAHKTVLMRQTLAARPWLRVYQLPSYAPELNPAVKVWSVMKRGLANLATATTATALTTAVKSRLKRMQYRAGLINSYLAATGPRPP